MPSLRSVVPPASGRHGAVAGAALLVGAALIVAASAAPLAAQEERAAPPAPPPATAPAALDRDVESMDAIVNALYEVISGPAGARDWDRFRSLFVPGARLIPSVPDTLRGGASAKIMSVEEYIAAADKYFASSGFFEREIARRTDDFGNIADLWSVYESRHAAEDPEPFQRGINSIHLLKDGERWWVVTIFWDAERPDNPIPAKYLPPAEAPGDAGSRGEPPPPPAAPADTSG
jgi:hypothetical protein